VVVPSGIHSLRRINMCNKKRQFVGAFVFAAMMAVAMPLSAEEGTPGPGGPSASICGFLNGILLKSNAPEAVGQKLLGLFGCA
jgi:hypothetical protein